MRCSSVACDVVMIEELNKLEIKSIQFPSIRYFTLFNVKCIVGKQDCSILSDPDLAILCRALHNDHNYNIGAIIASSLHKNKTKGKT